jgi:hypothetical protein
MRTIQFKAVSQMLWPLKGGEEWFSLGETHERLFGFDRNHSETAFEHFLRREREGVRFEKAAARNIRAISCDVERCIDLSGAPKGGRACCY